MTESERSEARFELLANTFVLRLEGHHTGRPTVDLAGRPWTIGARVQVVRWVHEDRAKLYYPEAVLQSVDTGDDELPFKVLLHHLEDDEITYDWVPEIRLWGETAPELSRPVNHLRGVRRTLSLADLPSAPGFKRNVR